MAAIRPYYQDKLGLGCTAREKKSERVREGEGERKRKQGK